MKMNNFLFNSFKNDKTKSAIIQTISEYEGITQDKVELMLQNYQKVDKANMLLEVKDCLVDYGIKHQLNLSDLIGLTQMALNEIMFDSKLESLEYMNEIKSKMKRDE